MAIMIPDSWTSRATAGEKRFYALLRDALPDHFTARVRRLAGLLVPVQFGGIGLDRIPPASGPPGA